MLSVDHIIESAKYFDDEEFEEMFDDYTLEDLYKIKNFLENTIKIKQLDKVLIIPNQKFSM